MTEESKCAIGVTILQNGLALGGMYEPSMPDVSGEEVDTTSQNNIGGVTTRCIGKLTNGNFGFKIHFTGSAAQTALISDIYDRDTDIWTVVMPMGSGDISNHSWTWSGQIAKSPVMVEDSGNLYIDLEVTVNGKMTHVSTAGVGLTTTSFGIVNSAANALTPSPTAAPTVYEYTVEAYSDDVSVLITPVATAGTIYINGTVVATTVASGVITLNTGIGAVTYVSIVVTDLNKTPRVYWIKFVIGTAAHPE